VSKNKWVHESQTGWEDRGKSSKLKAFSVLRSISS